MRASPAPVSPRRLLDMMGRLGGLCLVFAILAMPTALKLSLGFVKLTLSDMTLGLALLLLAPVAASKQTSGDTFKGLLWPLLFVACAAASVGAATNRLLGLRELAQLSLYCLAGAWMYTYLAAGLAWRKWGHYAFRGALAVGLLGCLLRVLNRPDALALIYGSGYGLACSLILTSLLCSIDLAPGHPRKPARTQIVWPVIAALGVVILYWPVAAADTAASIDRDTPPGVPQRYLEAYASLSVLASSPLLGVGLGNYQLHIGEYYQGMPKDNTIVPGTRIGYAVLLASTGILGLTAYVYWLINLWRRAAKKGKAAVYIKGCLAALAVCGFLTPICVGRILLPLALLHGLILSEAPNNA